MIAWPQDLWDWSSRMVTHIWRAVYPHPPEPPSRTHQDCFEAKAPCRGDAFAFRVTVVEFWTRRGEFDVHDLEYRKVSHACRGGTAAARRIQALPARRDRGRRACDEHSARSRRASSPTIRLLSVRLLGSGHARRGIRGAAAGSGVRAFESRRQACEGDAGAWIALRRCRCAGSLSSGSLTMIHSVTWPPAWQATRSSPTPSSSTRRSSSALPTDYAISVTPPPRRTRTRTSSTST